MTGSSTKRARQALPWLLVLYGAGRLLHLTHNDEHLAHYPKLPASWSRGDVYLAWCCLTALGVGGYLLWLRGNRTAGLTLLALYALLGFGGLLHYTRAPFAQHSSLMNLTIWAEAFAAGLLLTDVVLVAAGARSTA